jgi:hypothetical protein
LTEKQIVILEQMRESASGGMDHSPKGGNGKFTEPTVVATLPDGKYQLTRGSELAIGGSGTTSAVLWKMKEPQRVLYFPFHEVTSSKYSLHPGLRKGQNLV